MKRNTGKNAFVWVITLCLIFSTVGTATAAASVSDIKDHWAESAISSWVNQSLVVGYEDGTFRPEVKVNRQEFAALVNRSFVFTEAGTIEFTDVAQTDWAYSDIAKAKQAGYVTGYPDGTFKPKQEMSRQEVAVTIAKLLALKPSTSADLIKDLSSIPAWSKGDIGAVMDQAIMTGYPDGTFHPLQATSRAEVIIILDKALKVKAGQGTVVPTPSTLPVTTPVPVTPVATPVVPGSTPIPGATVIPVVSPLPGTISQPILNTATVAPGTNVTISAPAAGDTAWLAPTGTTIFAAGANMTSLTGNGTSTTVTAPLTAGDYHLFLVNAAGMSAASAGILTVSSVAVGPSPVNLGTAGNFAILAKTGISSVPNSAVTGNIGVSPIDATAITGLSLTMDATNEFAISSQITGKVYASDYTSPTSVNLTTAISNVETAYTDAAGRAVNYTELYSGDLSGQTLTAGVYKWGTAVLINSNVTLHGGPNDVWIFQIGRGITQASGTNIILTGGAQAKNIFWQTAETVSIGTDAHFEGNILSMTNITMGTNASVNGRLLAQTAVTLDKSTVVAP
ncbi:ice-binding family protein [Paenibacillus psychroresistens]|uniref:ice-binding family protein n=1 Tax=Paenibacillus psychroresistens TaxID=1778678 RepID=UPI001391C8CE|nr:ice-binding family protein [Paenibacillus psychroresistens]